MSKKKIVRPFQEGYFISGQIESLVFTDYRWDDGSVSRLWHIAPDKFDASRAILRPLSPQPPDESDQ
ncbi:hypothetical protein CEW89_13775 [Celeribacter ethanolicus]|uniref:Uncharacterized protein n=1 Tax=Celeribacter ethanolicus TaxID=1758178 RepID=A0A291GEF9_9RHOB|nr:hypothetical protein [Celeribacter ethanolicus]ATG48538.1 hypothetical protein CEW89_13775 [Celeribacter ethanolicus]